MIDFGLTTVLALGLVLGMKHALEADHVVAVSTIVSRDQSIRGASVIGAFWGAGHTLSLFLVGGGILALKISIIPRVALAMEMAVGIMLVFLGGMVAAGLIRDHFHIHVHQHGGQAHTHLHAHTADEPHVHSHAIRRGYHSLAVGMVHGLAGSAALMLLVVSAIGSPMEGVLYLVFFGLGSILGMMAVSALISLPFVYSSVRFSGLNRVVTATASLASISLGTFLVYDIG
ncbi:MAG TPA: urease accessory protein UreH, partial [Nitrospiria bacterium]